MDRAGVAALRRIEKNRVSYRRYARREKIQNGHLSSE